MKWFNNFLSGTTQQRYMECGFSEEEAAAMAWIAQQKAKGKFVGATSGLFLALTWGHWHDRITRLLNISYNRRITQLGIIMGSILFCDFLFTGRRKGANEIIANSLLMNNNLFLANVDSLIENFDIFTRKFTQQEINKLNFRNKLIRTNHHDVRDKKWIYNEHIHTPESFVERIKSVSVAPWSDSDIKPTNFSKLIDHAEGYKLGIAQNFVFGWSPMH